MSNKKAPSASVFISTLMFLSLVLQVHGQFNISCAPLGMPFEAIYQIEIEMLLG